jgi:predicted DNA binding CopG/RHH family protein
MTTRKIYPDTTEQWESGELGRSEEFVAVSQEESDALDQVTAMKLVTMRLPIPLIETLKAIAMHHGIAYQPMVRDLLTRFAISEIKTIRYQQEKALRSAAQSDETEPVSNFIERERVATCA